MTSSMLHEIAKLRSLGVAELQIRWRELYGEESRSRNRDFLFRRLAWRVQELALGGLSDRARARITELGGQDFRRVAHVPAVANVVAVAASHVEVATPPRRDPRLPTPGTVISRTYRGRELRLLVLDDGFELDGVRYGSLSEAARAVTGQHWNGRLFWQLTSRKRKA